MLALGASLLAGCRAQGADGAADADPSATTAVALQGLPIPAGFTLQSKIDTSASSVWTYRSTQPKTLAEVDDWYAQRLPEGEPWNGWAACVTAVPFPSPSSSSRGVERYWSMGKQILALVTHDNQGQVSISTAEYPSPLSGVPGAPIC